MADGITFTTPDLQAFIRELQQLPQRVRERVLVGAVATGASVVRKAAIEKAPFYIPSSVMWGGSSKMAAGHPPPGTLKKAIYQARMVGKCTATQEVWIVDVRKGKASQHTGSKSSAAGPTQGTNKDAFYASWVEYGHFTRTPAGPGTVKARRTAARSAGTARWVAPQPFMRPAFDINKQAAFQAMADYIARNLPAATVAFKFIKAAA